MTLDLMCVEKRDVESPAWDQRPRGTQFAGEALELQSAVIMAAVSASTGEGYRHDA